MRYRPDIDGLRAIAVLSVLFYHARLGFPGGYVGVDVFFVISGFLITGILLKGITAGNFSYLEFWEKRIRRLVPALAVTTIVTAIAGHYILLPQDLIDLGGALVAQPLLLANVYFWRVVKGGYFGDPPEIRPMLHTWSLGVEEQFYVVFPLLLLALKRRGTTPPSWEKIIASIALASLLLSIVITPVKGVAAFFNLPTRAWELLVGGLIIFCPAATRLGSRLCTAVGAVGLTMVGYATFFYSDETPFPGSAALLPCFGTALIIWSGAGTSTVAKALSTKFLVFVGGISYSLYLWHWPLMAYGSYLGLLYSAEAKVASIFLSFWLGYASWRWIENPFRSKRLLGSRMSLAMLCAVYSFGSIITGLTFIHKAGNPGNWGVLALDYAAVKHDAGSLQDKLDVDPKALQPRTFGAQSGAKPRLILWGDSHARALYPVISAAAENLRVSGLQITMSASPALIDQGLRRKPGQTWGPIIQEALASCERPIVVMASKWPIERDPEIEKTIITLQGAGAYVIFAIDVPELPFDPARRLAIEERYPGPSTMPVVREASANQSERLRTALTKMNSIDHSRFMLVDLGAEVGTWESLAENGSLLYSDPHHLSTAGALKLQPLIIDRLSKAMAQSALKN